MSSLARSSALMASGTLVSRLLGLLRTSLTFGVTGVTGFAADGWQTANTLPNIFQLLLAGGVINAVIVPQITRAMRHHDGGEDYLNRLLTVGIAIMAITAIVLTFAAPLLVTLFVDGGWGEQARALTTAFAFLCMPQMFFYGLYTLLGQVLNARERFAVYMWAPALANVIAVAGLLWFYATDQPLAAPVSQWTWSMILVLAGSATLSIVAQALVLFVPLRQIGFRYRPTFGLSGLGSASRMAVWAFAAVAVSQLGFVVTSRVLTNATDRAGTQDVVGAGAGVYQSAFLLFMLPHGLITVSLVTALFTRISVAAGEGRDVDVRRDLRRGMRTAAVILIPVTAVTILLGPLITQTVLFTSAPSTTRLVVPTLVAMILGLLPYGWLYLVQRVYYAYEDGRTPFRLQLLVTAVATAFNLFAATRPPGQVAMWVGVGQSISNLTAAVVGLTLLRGRLGPLGLRSVVRQHARLLLATAAATLLGWGVLSLLGTLLGDSRLTGAFVGAAVGGGVLLVSLLIAGRLRVREVAELAAPLTRRLGRVG